MDFSVIFQLRTKKFWWMDVIFYFVISLLVATVFCYLVFLVKNNMQSSDIKQETAKLQQVGTDDQKEHEKEVINYRGKINDFAYLLDNHEFASNVFAFMQAQTMPNIWFKQFGLDEKNSAVQLSGESEDMDAFSRQVSTLEKNKYVKSIGSLNSSLGQSARIQFNLNLVLNQNIFNYLPVASPATPPSDQPATPASQTPPAEQGEATPAPGSPGTDVSPGGQEASAAPSSEKAITSFNFILNTTLSPEIVGIIDEASHIITLNVPYGTGVNNLVPLIVVSAKATIDPDSTIPRDFTTPVTYRITAEDGSIQVYGVRVNILPQQTVSVKTGQSSNSVILIIGILVCLCIIAAVAAFIFLKKRKKDKIKSK